MSVGCIRPSYLVLLGIAVATLLFYAAYISTSPFVVRLPTPRSHHQQQQQQQQQQQYNESLIMETSADTMQNHSDVVAGVAVAVAAVAASSAAASSENPQKIATKNHSVNTAVSAAASPAVQQLNNTTLSASDAISMGVIAQSMYESGHLDVNQNICSDLGNTLQLLIMVTSAPSHSEARMAVRQTWGHYGTRRDVSIAFMLGSTSTKNATLNAELNTEEYMYGDIIRGKFVDTYDNLTLKTISMLEWVDNYCPNVAFILKTDDDMFINVSKLLSFISKHKRSERTIYGRLAKKWKPIRNKRSKYYISPQQFKPGVFPDFTTGPAYLIPSCVVHDLYLAALNHTYVKLEDVFITGIVANYINVKRVHVNEFLNKRISFNPCNIQKGISIHMVKYSEQFDLWKKLLDGRSKCK